MNDGKIYVRPVRQDSGVRFGYYIAEGHDVADTDLMHTMRGKMEALELERREKERAGQQASKKRRKWRRH